MKMKKVTAILMSLSMAISTCLPLGGTTALAAEIPGTGETAAVSTQEASETDEEDYEEGEAASEEEPEETVSAQTDSTDPETEEETEEETEADGETDSAENGGEDFEPDTQKEQESAEAADTSAGDGESQSAASTEEGTASSYEPAAEEIEESSETKDAAKGEGEGSGFEDAISITVGSEVTVALDYQEQRYFCFTPEENGQYEFCVTVESDSFDPYGSLYDGTESSMNWGLLHEGGHNYGLKEYLDAGATYYFLIGNLGETGNAAVHVEYMLFEAEAAEYDSSYEADSPVTLKVNTQCVHLDEVTYEWYDYNYDVIDGETGESISLSLSEPGYYDYTCLVRFRDQILDVVFSFEITDYTFEAEAAQHDSYYKADSPVTLKVNTQCDHLDEVTYEWYDNDNELIDGETGDSISLSLSKPGDYEYSCIVNYRSRTETIRFPFEIEDYLKVSQNAKNIDVSYGDPVTMTVNADSGNNSDITYTWERSGYRLINGSLQYYREELPYNTNSITVTADLTAEYSCRVELYDSYKREYCSFDVYVDDHMEVYPEGVHRNSIGAMADTITIRPDSPENLTLRAVVRPAGLQDLSFYWEKDEETIEGENSDTLHLDTVRSGVYTCTVYDERGNHRTVTFDVKYGGLTLLPKGSETVNGEREDILYIKTEGNYTPYKLETELIASDDAEVTYSWRHVTWEGNQPHPSKESYLIRGQNEQYPFIERWICTAEDQYGNKDEACFILTDNFTRVTSPNGYLKYWKGTYFYTISLPIEGNAWEGYTPLLLEAYVEDATLPGVEYTWTAENPFFDLPYMEIDGNKATVMKPGSYIFMAFDVDRVNRSYVYFHVYDPNELEVYPEGSWYEGGQHERRVAVSVSPGESTTLNVLSDEDASGYTYTWFDSRNREISGENTSSLTISPEFSGTYACEVRSEFGQTGHAYFDVKVENDFLVLPVGHDTDPDHYIGGTNLFTVERQKGETVTLSAEVSAANESGIIYDWKAHDLSDEVPESGWKEVPGGGGSSIQVAPDRDTLYECEVMDAYHNTCTVSFKVINIRTYELEDANVGLSQAKYTYNGKEAKPAVRVEYYGTVLTEGADYVVSYTPSDLVSAGTKSVEITPAEGSIYKGSKTVTYTVGKAAQTVNAKIDAAKLTVGASSKITVSGLKESAGITYKSSNTAVATVGTDGKVTAKKVGTAVITAAAAATGNYAGKSTTIKVTVLPAATTALTAAAATNGKGIKLTWKKVAGATNYIIKRRIGTGAWKTIKTVGNVVTYTDAGAVTNGAKYSYQIFAKGSTGVSTKCKSAVTYFLARPSVTSIQNSASRKMSLKWSKNTKANGYQIQYGLKSSFSGAKSVSVTKNSIVTKVIGSLTKGKIYYVRVRSYKKVSGKTYYSAWSAAKKLAIKK